MQQLKVYIPSLNQEYIFQSDFQTMNYDQLIYFVKEQLKMEPIKLEFKYMNNGQEFHFWEESNFKLVQQIALEQGMTQVSVMLVEQHMPLVAKQVSVHNFVCSTCKVYPISGARYKCYVCKNTDFCGNCYQQHNHPIIMITDPNMSLEQFKETIGMKLKKVGQSMANTIKSSCQSMSNYMTEKRQQQRLLQEQKQQQSQSLLSEKLLRLPQIYEQDPERYQEIIRKGEKMTLKELSKLID